MMIRVWESVAWNSLRFYPYRAIKTSSGEKWRLVWDEDPVFPEAIPVNSEARIRLCKISSGPSKVDRDQFQWKFAVLANDVPTWHITVFRCGPFSRLGFSIREVKSSAGFDFPSDSWERRSFFSSCVSCVGGNMVIWQNGIVDTKQEFLFPAVATCLLWSTWLSLT